VVVSIKHYKSLTYVSCWFLQFGVKEIECKGWLEFCFRYIRAAFVGMYKYLVLPSIHYGSRPSVACRAVCYCCRCCVFICALLLCFCVLSLQADCNRNIDLPVQDFSCPLCISYEAEAFDISLYLTLAWNFQLSFKWLYVTPDAELKHRIHSHLARCHM
jgi:hypothetical protein